MVENYALNFIAASGDSLHRALRTAVGAAAVEIYQDFARLGSLAGADDAAAFEFVHDARGAGVAEAEPALHQGDAGFLFAADDFDALLDEFLVFINPALDVRVRGRLGKLFVDFHFVTRLALLGNEFNDVLQFLVGDERALGAFQIAGTGRQVEHVAFAEELVRAHRVENRARVHAARDLKRNARRNVRLDDAGDDIHGWPLRGDDAMDAGRASHLRDAGDGHFDIRRRDEHEVRQLVNDHDDVGQPFRNDDVFLARDDDF